MAAACCYAQRQASVQHPTLPTLWHSRCYTDFFVRRGSIGLVRCAAEKQTALQLLAAARARASLRAVESCRKDPLFHDPYAGCLAAMEESFEVGPLMETIGDDVGYYELATKFIDDKLMEAVKDSNKQVRQVVLLSDGMDTRPYRLPWPVASSIFDVSPSSTYNVAAKRLEAVGAKVQRGRLLRHVSVELLEDGHWKDESWERKLVNVGYQTNRPSIWAMQGLQTLTSEGLQVILRCVSSLAMKDSTFIGELPFTALGDVPQGEVSEALFKAFGSNGFDARLMPHEDMLTRVLSEKRQLTQASQQSSRENIAFVATQLKLSDSQLDDLKRWISEMEEVDEEGFED